MDCRPRAGGVRRRHPAEQHRCGFGGGVVAEVADVAAGFGAATLGVPPRVSHCAPGGHVDTAGEGQPVMRSAASLPDSSTGGTPTPGVVPEPARTTLSRPRTRLRG